MKREEKNQLTRQRILDSALAEFALQGYGASSVNTISNVEGLSKGIIYHYFETKDDLYLTCVEQCFQMLTDYLKEKVRIQNGTATEQLESYFRARLTFFLEHSDFQRIFCGAVITPPLHLAAAVRELKSSFDAFNITILNELLEPVSLRTDITMEEVIEMFQQYQDFINAKYQMTDADAMDICEHELSCHRALNILLYGIIARKEQVL